MPKTNGLTLKQRKFRKELLKTLSPTEAAMRAYNCKDRDSASQIAYENLRKLEISMPELMNRMGLTDEEDIKDLIRLRKAVKQISCNVFIKKDGEMKGANGKTLDFIEVDDNLTQLKALELTCKLKGHLRDKYEIEHKGELFKQIIVINSKVEDELGKELREIGNREVTDRT